MAFNPYKIKQDFSAECFQMMTMHIDVIIYKENFLFKKIDFLIMSVNCLKYEFI